MDIESGSLKKTHIYVADPVGADRQILAQHHIDTTQSSPDDDKLYFYLHDRLGLVRLVLADNGDVVKYYTYEPFGQVIESSDGPPVTSDGFLFTGQWFDAEIEEYYLRASSLRDISVGDRPLWDMQYNPQIPRFPSRDPVGGKFKKPLTLHKYLYCGNDPINWADPSGETALNVANAPIAVTEMYAAGPRK